MENFPKNKKERREILSYKKLNIYKKMEAKNKLKEVTIFDNVKDLIKNSAKIYKENIAFTVKIKNKDNQIEYVNHTYHDFIQDINTFGTGLYDLNLKNKRVAIFGRNRYEWVIAHMSNLFGGIVSVPIDKELQLNELEESLIRSKVEAIVFDEKYTKNILKIKQNGKTKIQQYISMGENEGFLDFEKIMQKGKKILEMGKEDFIEYDVDPEKLSILLFTSGTTSKSKAVMLNQKAIAANICDMLMVERLEPTDTNIAFLPFHHIFGGTGMMVMLASGVRTVFPDGLKYIKQNLIEYKVSVFVGVPLLVNKMYENIEKEIEKKGKTKLIKNVKKISSFLRKFNIDIRRKVFKQVIDGLGGRMRLIVCGGAPLDKNVALNFNQLGIHLVQGYGLTETCPVIAAENDKYIKPGSCGIPMYSMQVDIVNKDADGIGEIRVKGPNIMLGYYENEEATNAVLKDGWFYTGDLGYLDEEGFLYLTGRQKDVIVLKNGKKVFPEELETLINKIPEVEESFIYGLPQKGDKNDPMIAVEIVYDEGLLKDKTEEDLRRILWDKIKEINKTLPTYKYIKNMKITKEPLIKTTTKKIKRNEEIKKVLE